MSRSLGRRVRTVLKPGTAEAKTTEHVYGTGAAVLEEYVGTTGSQSLARWFIHGESFPDPLYMIDRTAAGDVAAGTEEWLYYLKDALGSVMALVSLDSGSVVERYAYDPYGRTEVLAIQIIGFGALAGEESELYHDTDLDGDVDAADAADLMSCIGSTADDCVFFHDRTGNGRVDFVDAVLVANVFGGIGQTGEDPPKGHGRAVPKGINVALEANTNGAGGGAPAFDLEDLETCFGSSDIWCTAAYDEDESGTVDLGDLSALAGEIIIKPPPDVINLRSRFDNPFLWTGQRYDPETKLYHFWARTYDPNTGRFLQEDMQGVLSALEIDLAEMGWSPSVGTFSALPNTEYSDGFNLYQYAMADPISRTDPRGLFSFVDILGTGAAQAEMVWADVDTSFSTLSAILPFMDIFESRNLELEELAGIAADGGDFDAALADFEISQQIRAEELTNLGRAALNEVDAEVLAMFGVFGLPKDFFKGSRNHVVYIGYDENGKAAYVGRTTDFNKRRAAHKAKYPKLRRIASGLTRRQAQAIEEHVRLKNPHFDNVIPALSKRHKWYTKAMDWAKKAVRGRGVRF